MIIKTCEFHSIPLKKLFNCMKLLKIDNHNFPCHNN